MRNHQPQIGQIINKKTQKIKIKAFSDVFHCKRRVDYILSKMTDIKSDNNDHLTKHYKTYTKLDILF